MGCFDPQRLQQTKRELLSGAGSGSDPAFYHHDVIADDDFPGLIHEKKIRSMKDLFPLLEQISSVGEFRNRARNTASAVPRDTVVSAGRTQRRVVSAGDL